MCPEHNTGQALFLTLVHMGTLLTHQDCPAPLQGTDAAVPLVLTTPWWAMRAITQDRNTFRGKNLKCQLHACLKHTDSWLQRRHRHSRWDLQMLQACASSMCLRCIRMTTKKYPLLFSSSHCLRMFGTNWEGFPKIDFVPQEKSAGQL